MPPDVVPPLIPGLLLTCGRRANRVVASILAVGVLLLAMATGHDKGYQMRVERGVVRPASTHPLPLCHVTAGSTNLTVLDMGYMTQAAYLPSEAMVRPSSLGSQAAVTLTQRGGQRTTGYPTARTGHTAYDP